MDSSAAPLIIVTCCILSCISSSIWGYEAYKISKAGRCGDRSVIFCPLNENLGDEKYKNDLKLWVEQGNIKGRHIFNSYYFDDNNPTGFEYCSENYSTCVINNKQLPLTEFLIYKTNYSDNLGKPATFYIMPANIIMDMATKSKTISSLEEFTNTLKTYDSGFKLKNECSKTTDPSKRQNFFNDCIFFNYPFDSIVTVLKSTFYNDLNANIRSSYFTQIDQKIKSGQTISSFEFFSYFAIKSVSDRKTYKFLTRRF